MSGKKSEINGMEAASSNNERCVATKQESGGIHNASHQNSGKVDLKGIFPKGKIKQMILKESDGLRVSAKALDLIAACSAAFLRDLAQTAVKGMELDGEDVVNVDCIEMCVEGDNGKYGFLQDIIHDFSKVRETAGVKEQKVKLIKSSAKRKRGNENNVKMKSKKIKNKEGTSNRKCNGGSHC